MYSFSGGVFLLVLHCVFTDGAASNVVSQRLMFMMSFFCGCRLFIADTTQTQVS